MNRLLLPDYRGLRNKRGIGLSALSERVTYFPLFVVQCDQGEVRIRSLPEYDLAFPYDEVKEQADVCLASKQEDLFSKALAQLGSY